MDAQTITSGQRLTNRTLSKMETKRKVLAAARTLFSERGYERTGIRDVAAAIGMSTGAVFASFTSKEELFHQAVHTEYDGYRNRLERIPLVAPAHKKIADLLMIDHEPARRGFLRAEMELSWSPQAHDGSQARTDYLRELLRTNVTPFSAWEEPVFDLFFLLMWSVHLELCRTNVPDARTQLEKTAQRAIRMLD